MPHRIVLFLLLAGLACAPAAASASPHAIGPEDYFSLVSPGHCALSPNGRFVAFRETRWADEGGDRQRDLWLADLDNGGVRRLTFDGFGAGDPAWSPDGNWIYVSGSRRTGDSAEPPWDGSTQVWRLSPAGGQPLPMTRVSGGIGLFRLSADGNALFYTVSEKVHEEEWRELRKAHEALEYGHGVSELDSLRQLDLGSWRTKECLAAQQVIHDFRPSPDGRRVALITADDEELIFKEGWSRVEVLDLAGGGLSLLTGDGWRDDHPSPYGWIEELAWSADGDSLAFSIAFDGYATRVYLGRRDEGETSLERVTLPPGVMFAGGLTWRGTGNTLCFRGEARARIRVESISNPGPAAEHRCLTPGDLVVDDFCFSRDGRRLVIAAGGPEHFADLFLQDEDGTRRQVTDLNPQVAAWALPQLSVFSWTGADGDTVEGILELPPGYRAGEEGPLPLVLELHGGPTASTTFRLRFWIYGRTLMAARGYALLSPNYHGSTGYGEPFLEKLIGRENEIEVTDIISGAEALVAAGIADPERIGVMGWSNGGYLTNCVITERPGLFKAASSGAGVLDQVIQWGIEDTPGHVINYMRGLPWERAEAYRKASPLFELHRVSTPTLVHVGGADPRVPPAHSRALYRALHHYLGVPAELVVYPGAAHSLSTRAHRLAKMEWDLAWFDRYLPPGDSGEESGEVVP